MTFSNWHQRLLTAAFVAATGSVMAFSCTGFGEKIVNNVNPCGTILNCDPVEYELLTTDFPDYDLDPTCTIPGQCDGAWPYSGAAQ